MTVNKKMLGITLAALITSGMAVSAMASDLSSFQPFTDVKLDVFEEAGWTTTVDEWEFSAEVDPVQGIETQTSSLDDEYSITMDLKIVYSAGICQVAPRFIFKRSGMMAYYDDRMTDVYIRTGENRYDVDTKGCSRSTNSKNSTATDSSVEVMRETGVAILEDLAYSEFPIEVKIGDFSTAITLTDADQAAIKAFYETCKEAGVFEQPFLKLIEDDYRVITLFNEGSPDLEEDAMEETELPEAVTEAEAAEE